MSAASNPLAALTSQANALKAAGRLDEAIAVYARAVMTAPGSAVAEHNLAAALGDAARPAEAEVHCRRALAKGLDAPETWLVLARALQGLRRFDEAEQTFREVIARRPSMLEPHRELSQLIWMRSEDIAAATADIDRSIAANPADAGLRLIKAKALEYAEAFVDSYAVLKTVIAGLEDSSLETMAANAALRVGRPAAALAHAEKAVRLAPFDVAARTTLAQVRLAAGQAGWALDLLAALRAESPLDQYLIALQGTAWRMSGDPRARELFDYASLVGSSTIDAPPGWASLEGYLSDLASALTREHPFLTHPFNQSVRHGSQAPDILAASDPAIRAFPKAVEGPIRRRLQVLGTGQDVVRARNTEAWAFQGVWSVRLRPDGYHADHVHPRGWLSSACYIALPAAVQGAGREGWLKFGQPGVPTDPALGPEHFVRPEPGLLVLFPSYMWHGTTPFSGQDRRLTIAFDLVPAAPGPG